MLAGARGGRREAETSDRFAPPLLRLDESCIASHAGERAPRQLQDGSEDWASTVAGGDLGQRLGQQQEEEDEEGIELEGVEDSDGEETPQLQEQPGEAGAAAEAAAGVGELPGEEGAGSGGELPTQEGLSALDQFLEGGLTDPLLHQFRRYGLEAAAPAASEGGEDSAESSRQEEVCTCICKQAALPLGLIPLSVLAASIAGCGEAGPQVSLCQGAQADEEGRRRS